MEILDNIHGSTNASPNAMYKKYVHWHQQKYGDSKKPLSFKDWLEWANKKGLIEYFNAESNTNLQSVKNENQQIIIVPQNYGRCVATLLLTTSVIMFVVNVFYKKQQ